MGLFNSKHNKNDSKNSAHPLQSPHSTYDIIISRLHEKDWKDRLYFDHSVKGLAGISVFSSVVVNTIMRRSLVVYEGFMYSTFCVGLLSSMINNLVYHQFVQWPLLEGKLNCSSCAMIRGSLVQTSTAVLFPCILSYSIGVLTGERYNSTKMPHPSIPLQQDFKDHFRQKLYPNVRMGLRVMLIFQAVAGAWIAYKQYDISRDLLSTLTESDVKHLWSETLKNL